MRSGLQWDEATYPVDDPRNSVAQLEASGDWIQFVLDLPMDHEPGEVWGYNSGGSQLLDQSRGWFIPSFLSRYGPT